MVPYIVVIIISYLLGSISFSVIFSKKFAGFDVREKGSNNAGATNVLRTAGWRIALLTLVCDILKGIVAILIARLVGKIFKTDDGRTLQYLAGLMAIFGHTFPIFFKFKGGKGVASALGILFVLNWKMGLICMIFALVTIILTRMVSVGSILAAILYPILTIFIVEDVNIKTVAISIFTALLVIFNHRANIKRIKNGTENKISFKS